MKPEKFTADTTRISMTDQPDNKVPTAIFDGSLLPPAERLTVDARL
jgi:hypothetical protein